MPDQPITREEQAERVEFERWASQRSTWSLSKDHNGDYMAVTTYYLWKGWRERAASAVSIVGGGGPQVDLDEMQAMLDKTTKGEWTIDIDDEDECRIYGPGHCEIAYMSYIMSDGTQPDAEFFLAARKFIPQAIAELRSLRSALAAASSGGGAGDSIVDLVARFGAALQAKLLAAREKYGYHQDGWLDTDWEEECRAGLLSHIAKGDPRDVAAYCAFMWHHGWSTAPSTPPQVVEAEGAGTETGGEQADPWIRVTSGLPEHDSKITYVLGRWDDGDVRRCEVHKGELHCSFPARGGYPTHYMPDPGNPRDGWCVTCGSPKEIHANEHWGSCINTECAAFGEDKASVSYLPAAALLPTQNQKGAEQA